MSLSCCCCCWVFVVVVFCFLFLLLVCYCFCLFDFLLLAFGMIFMDILRRVLKTDIYPFFLFLFLIMTKRSYVRLINCTGTACVEAVSKVVYLP